MSQYNALSLTDFTSLLHDWLTERMIAGKIETMKTLILIQRLIYRYCYTVFAFKSFFICGDALFPLKAIRKTLKTISGLLINLMLNTWIQDSARNVQCMHRSYEKFYTFQEIICFITGLANYFALATMILDGLKCFFPFNLLGNLFMYLY